MSSHTSKATAPVSVDGPYPSRLSMVLQTLRGIQPVLRDRNVLHAWVFGSVARGEDSSESDLDLLVEFDPGAKVSLTAVSRLRLDLSDLLFQTVDLAEWRTLRPEIEAEVRSDAVQAF